MVLRSLIHFEMIFVYGVTCKSLNVHFFTYEHPVVITSFAEELSFPPLAPVKNQLAINVKVYF